MKSLRTYTALSWIPLALWIGGKLYVSQFEGWGAWAAGPMLLIPLAVSLAFGLVGVTLAFNMSSADRRSFRYIGSLVLSWLPIIHVILDNLWRSLTKPGY